MKNLETCHHCGEEKENCFHGYIAMCIPIPEMEEKIEKWNLIDAYSNYVNYPLATIHDHHTNILYKNRGKGWCLLNGRSMASPHPTRHLLQEEFINKIKTDPEFSKKWYTKTWWKQLKRTDLNEEEFYELDSIATYDQLLNTVGRGVQCDDCGKKEAELYKKYYPKSLQS
jgi:hypothetical protein